MTDQIKNNGSDQSFNKFHPILASCLNQIWREWRDPHETNVGDFQHIISSALVDIDDLAKTKSSISDVWLRLSRCFDELKTWLDRRLYVEQELSLRQLVDLWNSAFRSAGTDGASPDSHQLFDVRQLSLDNAFQRFLVQEWEAFLDHIRDQLGHIYELLELTSVQFLLIGEKSTRWEPNSISKVPGIVAQLSEKLQGIAALQEKNKHVLDEAMLRLTKWQEETLSPLDTELSFTSPPSKSQLRRLAKGVRNAQDELVSDFLRSRDAWYEHFSGEQRDWQHDIVLTHVQLNASIGAVTTVEKLRANISQVVESKLADADKPLALANQVFSEALGHHKNELTKSIRSAKNALLKQLRSEILPQIMDAVLAVRPVNHIAGFLEQTKADVNRLTPQHVIFRKRDNMSIPPKSEFAEIPVGELFTEKLFPELNQRVETIQHDIRLEIEHILQGISELDQIVEFNLEAALSAIQEGKDPDEVRDTATAGLQRARDAVSQFQTTYEQLGSSINDRLLEAVYNFVKSIQALLDNETAIELKVQLAHAKTKERARLFRRKLWLQARRTLPALWRNLKSAWQKLQNIVLRWRKLTGLAIPLEGDRETLYKYLSETHEKITALPYVYQRLFQIEPLTDLRFFGARDDEMKTLEQDFFQWQEGGYMSTVIIGERGSGRTTLLNFAEEDIYSRVEIYRVDVDETTYTIEGFLPYLNQAFTDYKFHSFEELEEELTKLEQPVACVVENIQNLFIKKVDGFDLLEQFLLLVSRTYKSVFWVFTCTIYSWNYLDKVLDISRFFRRQLVLHGFSAQDAENIIMKRHRVTGYQFRFEAPNSISSQRKYKKLESEEAQQAYLRNMFFSQLHQAGSDNISVMMLLWLRGIKDIDNGVLKLHPEVDLDYSYLYQLSFEDLFTLGAVLHHEMLKAEEHAAVFHQETGQSRRILTTLRNRGILIEKQAGFFIHPFLYRPVVLVLKAKNIIH